MTTAGLVCASCGTELPPNSKFCNECGAPVTQATQPAEYKQVTVLFADVVHSMDIAAAVGAERLREIMAELVDRCRGGGAALRRHGGQVHRRRDHGRVRCAGGVGGPRRSRLPGCVGHPRGGPAAGRRRSKTATVWTCSCASGLNSGQVIAGEIGSGAFRVTPPLASRSAWPSGWNRWHRRVG